MDTESLESWTVGLRGTSLKSECRVCQGHFYQLGWEWWRNYGRKWDNQAFGKLRTGTRQ